MTQYKRPRLHKLQVEAIKSQSVKAAEIFCWVNSHDDSFVRTDGVSYICCDDNWKFHGRFALALICKEKYVAVFDDDVVPGPDWFASCVEHAEYGILGSSGVILPATGYLPNSKVGHIGKHNEVVERVDLVGHSWFAHQDHFRYMFYEKTYSHDNGEDIQLAALARRHGGVECYVPPHPISNTDIWGCLPQYNNLGNDGVATSSNPQAHYKLRGEIVEWYKKLSQKE